MMDCIVKRCPNGKACNLLGECGVGHALERARATCGYEVHARDNPTVGALLNAGLVTESAFNGRTMIIRAVVGRS